MWDPLFRLFGGWKEWFYDVFIDGLVIAAWNFLVDVIQFFITTGLSAIAGISGGPESMVFQVTGLSGWFCEQLQIAQCITVILNAYLFKFLARKIPFIKW